MQKINNWSKKDIENIVREQVDKKVFAFEKMLNTLKNKVIDLEVIIENFHRAERRYKK